MNSFTLRPYQEEAVKAIENEWGSGNKKTLLVAATGTGKTCIFTKIMSDNVKKGRRELILAHRSELLEQAMEKIGSMTNIPCSLEKAGSKAGDTPIVVGSVQSFIQDKRLNEYDEDAFSDIIVDEAHHITSDSYQKILSHFPNANVLGVTATPDRMDEKALAKYFDSKAYEYPMVKAINDHFLSPISVKTVPLKIDIRSVRQQSGDFAARELSNVLTPYFEAIAQEMNKYCKGRTTLIFTPLIETSRKFEKILRENTSFRICEINGKSPDREEKIKDIRAGKYDVIINSIMLSEGFDAPNIDCIINLRATRSKSLYCLDEQTEILTPNGWKKDVEVGDKVAAFDQKTGEIKFVKALAKVRRPLKEDEFFCSIKGPSVDIRVTNHHRMLYDNKRHTGWKIKEAAELADMKDGAYLPVSGNTQFPGVPLTDAELTFIGWVMTDGNINKTNNAISISQSESHTEYCAEIEKCIIDCGFKYGKHINKRSGVAWTQNGNNVTWTISKGKPRGRDKHLKGWEGLEKWISKDLSPALYDMTAEQFDVMLQAIHHGDGAKNQYVSYHISKGNKTFIERLQIMAIQRGYRASISIIKGNDIRKNDLWTLHIKKQNFIKVGTHDENHTSWVKEQYTNEICWCVQNEFGTLVTRRNGKVTIMGNCQIVGRGTRLAKDKKNLLILDFLWQTKTFDLLHPSSLIAESEEVAKRMDILSRDGGEIDIFDLEERAKEDIVAQREAALAAQLERMKKKATINPIQFAFSIRSMELLNYQPIYGWEKDPVTDKQKTALTNFGFDMSIITTKGQASKLMSILMDRIKRGLSTPKQIQTLEKRGFKAVGCWTKDEASEMLDRLAKNRWRMPYGIYPSRYKPASVRPQQVHMR